MIYPKVVYPQSDKSQTQRDRDNEWHRKHYYKNHGKPKLYVIQCGETNKYKIGVTIQSIKHRVRKLQQGSPFELTVVFTHEYETEEIMKAAERMYHEMFESKRVVGEWFELNDSDLKLIKFKQ